MSIYLERKCVGIMMLLVLLHTPSVSHQQRKALKILIYLFFKLISKFLGSRVFVTGKAGGKHIINKKVKPFYDKITCRKKKYFLD